MLSHHRLGAQRSKLFALAFCAAGLAACNSAGSTQAVPMLSPAEPQSIASAATAFQHDALLKPNLLSNPHFTLGNTGFTSQYPYATQNTTEDQYTVGTDPYKFNSSWASFGDHTTGKGNMMIVNGATSPGVVVWSETVNVKPSTTYSFGFWGSGVDLSQNGSPGVIQVSFNGTASSKTATLPSYRTSWVHYGWTWSSRTSTMVTISLVDTDTAVLYNDFALDDMSLR